MIKKMPTRTVVKTPAGLAIQEMHKLFTESLKDSNFTPEDQTQIKTSFLRRVPFYMLCGMDFEEAFQEAFDAEMKMYDELVEGKTQRAKHFRIRVKTALLKLDSRDPLKSEFSQ